MISFLSKLFCALFVILFIASRSSDAVSQNPNLGFIQNGERILIFCNNPEQLSTKDFAEKGTLPTGKGASILRVEDVRGLYRDWWEHQNEATTPLGYGIIATNKGSRPVSLVITGQGWIAGYNGGKPFADAFNNTLNQTYTIQPQGYVWIFRMDDTGPLNTIFSGVVEFEVQSGSVTIDHVCYSKFSNIDPNALEYVGYVTRIDGEDEGRVYKGVTSASEVTSYPLSFIVDDSIKTGSALAIEYASFDGSGFGEIKERSGWYSNIVSRSLADAVGSDMVTFYMPGWGFVNPYLCCDGSGKFPNVGNWGIQYNILGTVTNNGKVTRVFTANLTGSGGFAPIAFRKSQGAKWEFGSALPTSSINYGTIKIAPGATTSFMFSFILGGPGSGGMFNKFILS